MYYWKKIFLLLEVVAAGGRDPFLIIKDLLYSSNTLYVFALKCLWIIRFFSKILLIVYFTIFIICFVWVAVEQW